MLIKFVRVCVCIYVFQKAENAFKFYKGYTGLSQYEQSAFLIEFERLKLIASKRKEEKKVKFADFCKSVACHAQIILYSKSF